ncbi:hypothetical protein TELCIR_01177 [Teladorsagia circumcincta]|uniref:Neurotransmitter-gated ion-channel ligand-binding domain-containing protein n=1 Tax=Teladorsagia circumcincta TaxID=45464 RepID=A0A2G9V2Y3_TELCI|nr:hypothetical protein TELCIR_01177 [Teladorsagia circumcincta]
MRCIIEAFEEFIDKQEVLVSKLLSGYRKDLPPIYARARGNLTLANPMVVKISLRYIKLLAINEPEQTIALILEYDLVSTSCHSVSDTRDTEIQHVHVKSNGDMHHYASRVITVVCPLKIQSFPFDHQICDVGFSSNAFWSMEVKLVPAVKSLINISSVGTGEWTVGDITTGNTTTLLEDTLPSFELVYFTIHIKRSSTFYIVMLVLPSFILTFLCVIGLFWTKFDKADYLDKLALGFAAILAMCTVLEIVEQSVPKTKQLPALSLFVMVNLLLITVSISVVVIGSKSCDFVMADKLAEWSKKVVVATPLKNHADEMIGKELKL